MYYYYIDFIKISDFFMKIITLLLYHYFDIYIILQYIYLFTDIQYSSKYLFKFEHDLRAEDTMSLS